LVANERARIGRREGIHACTTIDRCGEEIAPGNRHVANDLVGNYIRLVVRHPLLGGRVHRDFQVGCQSRVNPLHDFRQLAELGWQIASHIFEPGLGICREDEHNEGIAYAVGQVEPAELPLRPRPNQRIPKFTPSLHEAAHAPGAHFRAKRFQARHHRREALDVCVKHGRRGMSLAYFLRERRGDHGCWVMMTGFYLHRIRRLRTGVTGVHHAIQPCAEEVIGGHRFSSQNSQKLKLIGYLPGSFGNADSP
jgi:hypothetical protein